MDWSLAIDLGTTNTVAAVRVGIAVPVALPLSADRVGLPSSVFLSGATVYTGESAVRHAAEAPESFYPSPKRLLMQVPEQQLESLRPVFSALYREVYRRALGRHGPVAPARVVLTCPDALSDRGRTLLADAAADAGIDASTLDVVPEPVAAAAWYCRDITVPDRLLIVDVGGGTCDTALVRFDSSGAPVLMAAAGDNGLGGRTLDHHFAQALASRVDGGIPEPETLAALHGSSGYRAVEQAREGLSTRENCSVDLRFLFGDDGDMNWTRAEFEESVAGDITRIRDLVRQTLSASGEPESGPRICLTGGTALTPAVQQAVASYGNLQPVAAPFTAVALGALLTGATENPVDARQQDVVPGMTGPGAVTSVDRPHRRAVVRRTVAVVCALALVIAGTVFLTQRAGDSHDNADRSGAEDAATDSFDPSPAAPVSLTGDTPLIDSGNLTCAGVTSPAASALRGLVDFSGTPSSSGFNGITRCSLGTDGGAVSLETFRPNGFINFNASRHSDRNGVLVPAGDDLPGWYRLRQDSEIAPRDEVFLYVQGKGWFVITGNSRTALDTDAALTVARALDPLIERAA